MTGLSLSNRQHPMLRVFAEAKPDWYMSIAEAQKYDQRPFRSMLIQGWISYRPGRGFHVTKDGREAWRVYHATEIWRSEACLDKPLTAYFDPTAYGLHIAKKKAVA